jgi:hypothetical protein
VSVPVGGEPSLLVNRCADFSAGSHERELVAIAARQSSLDLAWLNEGVVVRRELDERTRELWLEALENTRGVNRAAWLEEITALSEPWSEWPEWVADTAPSTARGGTKTIHGVVLSPGLRQPDGAPTYWVSHEHVSGVVEIAGTIAEDFPQTGLWPLVWTSADDPRHYLDEPASVSDIDAADPDGLLRAGWSDYVRHHHIDSINDPGPPSLPPSPPAQRVDRRGSMTDLGTVAVVDARLMVVACSRPADAIALIGGVGSPVPGAIISAVLRSWEQRFGAVPVAIEPGHFWLAVPMPPYERDRAHDVAAEYCAFCPLPDDPTIEALVSLLMSAEQLPPDALDLRLRRHLWPVGWYR